MSAKLIYSLTDNENPDLQKQIGCMNGFFHFFDRHRRLTAHARINNALLPPPGQATEQRNNLEETKRKESTKKGLKEKDVKRVIQEKRRRSSTESSRHSFSSSSCSSSFSSLDFNNKAPNHPDPSPSSHNSSSGTPSRDCFPAPPPADHQPTRSIRPLDLRDVVKDSMRRDSSGLSSLKTKKEETAVRNHTLRHVDSPRPAKPRSSGAAANNDDSFRVFSKGSEDKEGRGGAPRVLRRLSYDGRESQDGLKSTVRIRELPRLSLDSRRVPEAKPYLLSDLRIEKRNAGETANMLQEPGSSRRASSVVAKLMGLVDPVPVGDEPQRLDNTLETEKSDPTSRSSRTMATTTTTKANNSNSPRLRNADSVPKVITNQKFPIETAPWRQQPPPVFKCRENAPLTVYGEIEKRLADLEFKKSGKDLRALKQILEAMQKSKVILDDPKDPKLVSQTSNGIGLDRSSISSTIGYKSPIVIMKPVKLMGRDTDPASATTPRTDNSADKSIQSRTTKTLTARTTPFNRQEDKISNTKITKPAVQTETSGRVSGSTSPRPRRPVLEKQSPPASLSDLNTRRRQNIRQPIESSSPGRKCRPRSSNAQRTSDRLSSDTIASPLQSESNISLASEDVDNEVTSSAHRDQSPNSAFGVNRKMATSEQPSPISVLDATFYRDESPSPVKTTSNAFKDDEISNPDEAEWTLMELDQRSNCKKSGLSADIDLKLSKDTELLSDNENSDHIYISHILSASDLLQELESGEPYIPFKSGHLINPKLFFALEQHRSRVRHLQPKPDEKVQRKIVFDVVNEILVRKLVATDSFTRWWLSSADKLTRNEETRGENRLLTELCSEVDRLRGKNSGSSEEVDEDSLRGIICEDMMHWPMNWAEYGKETPAVVLDVERLIFKDLITELVSGESAGPKTQPGGHCRQLFYK